MMVLRGLVAAALGAVVLAGCGGAAGDARQDTTTTRMAATTATTARPAVPILLYHHLDDPPAGDPHASLWVTPRRFAAQVRALRRAGFHAVTLARVRRAWRGGGRLPARPVVISFDDGYPEQDAIARVVLRRHRWPGVLNLQLDRLDVPGGLSRAAVARMVAAGWEIDDHSTTHPDLTRVDDARLKAEVAGSRAALGRVLGHDPMFFCYPYGRVDARVVRAVRAAGFLGATTTEPRRATARDDPFRLPRLVVRRSLTPAQLVALASVA